MTKHACLFLSLIFLSGFLLAQNVQVNVTPRAQDMLDRVDSLEKVLANTPDSLQWETLYELSQAYRKIPRKDSSIIQSGIMYSQRAEELALKNRDTIQLIKSLSPLIYFYQKDDSMKSEAKEMDKWRDELLLLRGYVIPRDYHEWIGEREESLGGRARVFYDSTSSLSVLEIKAKLNAKDRVPFSRGDRDLEEFPGSWWMSYRLRTHSEIWEEHVFHTEDNRNVWDTVEVFVSQIGGGFDRSLTGSSLSRNDWLVPDKPNHFRVNMPPKGDIQVFVRVKGFPEGLAPGKLRLKHINYESYLHERVKTRHANGIFQGVVLIQLFFFFLLYLATKDHVYGNYAIYILGLSLFILNINYFENMEDLKKASLFLLAIWLSTIGMLLFSHAYLNMKELMPKWKKPLTFFIILFTVTTVVIAGGLPFIKEAVTNGGLGILLAVLIGISSMFYGVMILSAVVFLPIWGFTTLKRGYAPAKYYLIATLFLFLGFLLPMALSPFEENLKALGLLEMFNISVIIEGGIALQLCLFALGVGHQRNLLEKERREALEKNLAMQREINTATDRFVPYEFLKTLGRESILDVNLGDQVEKYVTVFFSDIRDYTTLSEQLTPQQNFIFLNNYLGRVGPIIKTNKGFVNQYYGDGMMALFMDAENGIHSPKDSLLAALEMHKELYAYNRERLDKNREAIRIGIGIHTGPLMLGIIGDEKRMDVGVVSDTVNTAARMEGLTKFYGASTIVSGSTFDGIAETDGLHYRFLGQVLVKGKKEPIKIYDFYDGDEEKIGLKKENCQDLFKGGLKAYFAKDFKTAKKAFSDILKVFPEDKASQFYLEKSKSHFKTGVPEGWTGVEIIGFK